MDAVVKSPESCKRVIEVEVPADEVNSQFDQQVKKYKKDITLPGFRAGKVPVALIKSRYGDSIRAEVIESVVNEAYQKACTDNKINPVSQPVIDDMKADNPEEPVVFTATVEVDPDIEITDYKDLGITVDFEDVSDDELKDALENVRMQFADFEDLDRPAEKGDFVTLKYSDFTVDGAPGEGDPAPRMIEVGKSPLPELDEALVGMSRDEEKTVSLTFPDDFRIEKIAGKSGEFTVIVENVQERKLPSLDDEKILSMAQVESEDDLVKRVKDDLKKKKDEQTRNEAYDKAVDAILAKEGNDFEVPESRIAAYIEHIMQQEKQYYPNGGQPSFEEYLARFRDTAARSIKRFRILDFIAAAEKIKATKEEVDAKIQEIADQYNQDFDTVKDVLRRNGSTIQLREDLKQEKVLDVLVGLKEWPAEK
ncbi:MAG: trigger factor [Fibrobacterota bacterium]